MKKFYSQLSLILALILVINLCNIGYVIEVKAEAEDTSNLSIDKVDLDTSNAANISKDCILTSKELTVSIKQLVQVKMCKHLHYTKLMEKKRN